MSLLSNRNKEHQTVAKMTSHVLTTSNGNPVDNNQTSVTAGVNGPVLISDFHLIDKLAHFDRERIPERVVHAKGAGAHGYFEVTNDISKYTRADFLSEVGKRTPVFARFSTVGGEKGSADTARDPRGFAIKFYTEEGNWDMVGNNTPIFFIRDPLKFPDFIHTQKRNPQTNLKDADAFWDFLSLVPESIHQVTILFSDRGTPYVSSILIEIASWFALWRRPLMNLCNFKYVKWHFRTDQGIRNLTDAEAVKLNGENPDHATEDLFNAIERGDFPSWSVFVQIMEPKDAETYRWNIFDVTKVWPHRDYPLIPVGKLVLDRNPQNYFAETEQAAFAPSHIVPGIDVSEDRMLQGRLFSYPDTHRHRLGPNYLQIPINSPYRVKGGVANHQRDGPMTVNGNQGSAPNYEPNSFQTGPREQNIKGASLAVAVSGFTGRFTYELTDDDFVQAGNLYRVMSPGERDNLINNIVGHLKNANSTIQKRQVANFKRANAEYGKRVEEGLAAAAAAK
ncbi:catalase [Jimgerdemannia flammicorona]|uniref:Catalase n=1 Tax=Jimgerdemannia flammicorona TaxID=994334 RepID=A0A433QW02_9FUNG|nr:catalase [Jimgerdemannia flammicorona]